MTDFGLNFLIFEKNFFLLGIPEITTKAGGLSTCQGDNAITLTIETDLETAIIPFLDGLKDGEWFANFDGTVLSENTNWVLNDNNNPRSLVVSLPRSAIANQDSYEIQEGSSVILRATPEIFPFPPKSMFAKGVLLDLFSIDPFECCQNEDCVTKYGPAGTGQVRVCADNTCTISRRQLRTIG